MEPVLTREIRESDVAAVVQMVHDLAAYENSSDECRMTEDQLRAALFGTAPALFGHVAETDGRVVGFVLWFLNFSTWTGTHGVYGEDMYVEPGYRGRGVGQALFEAMGRVCVERGYQRLEFWTLDWNTDTIAFTASLGARPMSEWTVYRIDGPELARLGTAPVR
ncbi:GNAT family N-acetyltransferase [Actinophytocola sp.]|uniref:GNAT family N-acetyltransferase n=1 Tax=Actinophytocola sp. TaxID=1872138 RepID=UPI002D5C9906|nr:GNAT family N-acetyltransferase [Actinophytocola sp.]HYQ66135.1 GNAT family N-acetyltransferase [Actinophytocola sp.]